MSRRSSTRREALYSCGVLELDAPTRGSAHNLVDFRPCTPRRRPRTRSRRDRVAGTTAGPGGRPPSRQRRRSQDRRVPAIPSSRRSDLGPSRRTSYRRVRRRKAASTPRLSWVCPRAVDPSQARSRSSRRSRPLRANRGGPELLHGCPLGSSQPRQWRPPAMSVCRDHAQGAVEIGAARVDRLDEQLGTKAGRIGVAAAFRVAHRQGLRVWVMGVLVDAERSGRSLGSRNRSRACGRRGLPRGDDDHCRLASEAEPERDGAAPELVDPGRHEIDVEDASEGGARRKIPGNRSGRPGVTLRPLRAAGPGGTWPRLKSLASREPFLTLAVTASRIELGPGHGVFLELGRPTLFFGSATAAHEMPPSAMNSASEAMTLA